MYGLLRYTERGMLQVVFFSAFCRLICMLFLFFIAQYSRASLELPAGAGLHVKSLCKRFKNMHKQSCRRKGCSDITAWEVIMDTYMDLLNIRDIDNICCLCMIFVGGGIVGWIYEMLFYRINDGEFVHRGQGILPWLPIYAFGSVFICLLGIRFQNSKFAVFLVSAVVSAIVEYAVGWYLYTFHNGLRLWDYNTEIWNWGNINGYICLRSILLFAFAGVFLIFIAVPMIRQLSLLVPQKVFRGTSLALFTICMIYFLIKYVFRSW